MSDIDTDSYSEAYWNESYNPKRRKKPGDNPQGSVFDSTDHGRIKSSPVVNVEPKQEKRDEVEQLTTAFLANGGAITICKPGRHRKFAFSGPRPIAGMTGRRDNCLSRPQWTGKHTVHLSPGETRDLIRAAQQGNVRAKGELFAPKDRLLAAYQKKILKHLAEAGYFGPPPDELMCAALEGFRYAITKFDLRSNNGFWAYAEKCIRGRVLDYIKQWRRDGITGTDTRANRVLFSNPNLDAEELSKRAGVSLKTATRALDCADLTAVHYDTTEGRYDENGKPAHHVDPLPDFRRKYSCFDKYGLSPQLKILRLSEQTTWGEEKDFRRLRNQKTDVQHCTFIMSRCSQYPGFANSELWIERTTKGLPPVKPTQPERYYEDIGILDIRSAQTNREWQRGNWHLEPGFSDDHDYTELKLSEKSLRIVEGLIWQYQHKVHDKPKGRVLPTIIKPMWCSDKDWKRWCERQSVERHWLRLMKAHEAKGKQNHVRPNREQAIGCPIAKIVVFQSRGSGVAGLHLG